MSICSGCFSLLGCHRDQGFKQYGGILSTKGVKSNQLNPILTIFELQKPSELP